jgi:hypothetical protein
VGVSLDERFVEVCGEIIHHKQRHLTLSTKREKIVLSLNTNHGADPVSGSMIGAERPEPGKELNDKASHRSNPC